MSERLPLFPLSAVLFPEMLMPLHIFEPRYRLLVQRSLAHERPFGVVLLREGTETGGAVPHSIGTSATIVGHSPLPDGRSFIVVRGIRRFRILDVEPEAEPYLVGGSTGCPRTTGPAPRRSPTRPRMPTAST